MLTLYRDRTAAGIAIATLLLGAVVGSVSLAGLSNQDLSGAAMFAGDPPLKMFVQILVRNLSLIALLFSGVATAGVTTLLFGTLLGAYIGATMTAAAEHVGATSVVTSVIVYAPLEFLAFAVAAWGGLGPAIAVLSDSFSGSPQDLLRPQRWMVEMEPSLRKFGLSAALVALAAFLETIVIQTR